MYCFSPTFVLLFHKVLVDSLVGAQVKDGSLVLICTECKRTHNQYETSCGFWPGNAYTSVAALAALI